MDWERTLVVILAVVLIILLTLLIVALIKAIQILNEMKRITEQIHSIVDHTQSIGKMFNWLVGPFALGKTIAEILRNSRRTNEKEKI